MSRKNRREIKKHHGASASKDLSEKIFLFNKLPESCDACNKEFDKKDKDMVKSWNVVVKQEVVRLFCPECINTTKEALETMGFENENKETE